MSGEPAVGPESSAGADLQQPLQGAAAGSQGGHDTLPGGGVPEAPFASSGPAEAAGADPAVDPSDADPAERAARLEAQLAALRAEHDNLNSQYMRLAADFDNFRKRQSRDQDDQRVQITCSTLSEILPVVDNFERARQQLTPEHEEAQNLHRSYQGLYKQLVEVFKQLGVSPMRVEGEPFDPSLHEAVLREESHDHPEDVVIAELQRGYQLNGRVLRHALVKVSMGPGPGAGSGAPPAAAAAPADGAAGVPTSDS
ncbi:nucleotide exchange factor GrpE [Cyanobium sp. ATX 6A2]|uniref:nucleotide exchange factor GrpE n=1 Tax=Cyanobium sp. ATX 6A2 TaxID=2823700 RepID=UPI0020CF018C|nr:nucleotide exchange factor GrpE [Cyanobium sp. ATX 6A2]MCP9886906.1 nucleotide exchange factor GrpE [Cyanobium sp. ATX 6A2]